MAALLPIKRLTCCILGRRTHARVATEINPHSDFRETENLECKEKAEILFDMKFMYFFHEKGANDDKPSWASMQGTARRTDVSTVLAGKPTVPRATNTHNLLTLHPLWGLPVSG